MIPVTEWYDGSQAPVRIGWYERLMARVYFGDDGIMRYWWDGRYWCHRPGSDWSLWQFRPWRGLTARPMTHVESLAVFADKLSCDLAITHGATCHHPAGRDECEWMPWPDPL
jgi:hypothetical protein